MSKSEYTDEEIKKALDEEIHILLMEEKQKLLDRAMKRLKASKKRINA